MAGKINAWERPNAGYMPWYQTSSQNPMMAMWLDSLYRQQQIQQQAQGYQQFNNSLPAYLRITANTGQTQADRARSDYTNKTLNPMIAEASTSELNGGQNSTFAAGRIAALQIAGAAEASRLAEGARQGAIDDVMQQRQSYMGVPMPDGGYGYGGAPSNRQTEAQGSSWLDRLPAYAQLAYGGANALRYASPYVSPALGGFGNAVGSIAGGIGRGIRGMFGMGGSVPQAPAPANPIAGGGYFGDGYGPSQRYGSGF